MVKKVVYEWEQLDKFTKRIKVIGGWLVQHTSWDKSKALSESMVFINDQHWEWMPIEPFVDPQIAKKNLAKDYEVQGL